MLAPRFGTEGSAVERFDTFDKDDDFSVERKMKVRIVLNPDAFLSLPRDVFADPHDEPLN